MRCFALSNILAIACCLICQNVFAFTEDDFLKANNYYSSGNYSQAANLYEEIITQGTKSGNIYYNLGNAYFKLGRNGKALLNYERAKNLMPQDEDLFANCAFVRSLLSVQEIKENYSWNKKIFVNLLDMLSPSGWFMISGLLFWLINILLCIGLLKGSFRKNSYVFSLIISVIFLCTANLFFNSFQFQKQFVRGMIIVPKAEIRYSPSYSGAVAFELTEGMHAQIVSSSGDWTQIRLNRNNSGWIESQEIEKI
ncbi:MAG: hypothetical protein DRP78_01030 [Candidatus Omnitrophota bacterium]|nr:MAG: hypothetical protein DRP78_01030 [Candidatus Omnitrophota bacterium]